jgi:guanylate kinase
VKRTAIALYGPPASGKDTITAALLHLSADYVPFERLKVGSGRSNGYRPTTVAEVERLRDRGLVVYENERYGNLYVVDRPTLDILLGGGAIPVVHVGQIEGVRALKRYPAEWLTVLLWCPRQVAEKRVRERGSKDVAERLAAWDETAADLGRSHPDDLSLRIDTERQSPAEAARTIHAFLRTRRERS